MPPRAKRKASATADTKNKKAKKPDPKPDPPSEEEEEEEEEEKAVIVKGKAAVDAEFPAADSYHVLEEAGCVWNFTGNQTNIGDNNNKFYILQLLEHDTQSARYVTWTRWGRVGLTGQNSKLHDGAGLDAAKQAFRKKFKDKTANHWDNRDNFQFVKKKYDMVHIDYAADAAEEEKKIEEKLKKTAAKGKKPAKAKPPAKSVLEPPVKSLMELIFDVKQMTASVVEMKYDVKKLPLGKLTAEQIAAGYSALKECESLIKARAAPKQMQEASSIFYTRIPHSFGMKRPPVINTPQMLKEKMQLLEVLEDIKTALKIIQDSEDIASGEAQEDMNYKSLNCGLNAVQRGTETFDMVDAYMKNTHGETHSSYDLELVDLFEVDKDTGFDGTAGNKMLLWHGSRLTNWAGILSQGLRIAPPEAPCTGYMFGKGVYFADMVSKSANYCFTSRDNSTGLLLLCEVACGKQNELFQADSMLHLNQPKGTHSTWGKGKTAPDPAGTIVIDGDVQVPMGKGKATKWAGKHKGYMLQYNEFIVYNTSQVKFRYLLRVKFNYKGRW